MFSFQSVFVEGRLNFGRVIVPDLVSSNGVVQVIDTMLIPPTAELGLTIYDRIARTPWLKVHEEILLLLGGFLLIFVRAISMTACFVSTGDVGGGFASDRESHAAAARIAQQLARHELVSGGTASLDRAARCGKMLRRKVDFKLSFYFHTRNVTERVFNT